LVWLIVSTLKFILSFFLGAESSQRNHPRDNQAREIKENRTRAASILSNYGEEKN